eukprot:m.9699 g.9699  ORF g.9699 m.9699 type:complete len:100 (-) comp5483_c1_seq1:413-712(-)
MMRRLCSMVRQVPVPASLEICGLTRTTTLKFLAWSSPSLCANRESAPLAAPRVGAVKSTSMTRLRHLVQTTDGVDSTTVEAARVGSEDTQPLGQRMTCK